MNEEWDTKIIFKDLIKSSKTPHDHLCFEGNLVKMTDAYVSIHDKEGHDITFYFLWSEIKEVQKYETV